MVTPIIQQLDKYNRFNRQLSGPDLRQSNRQIMTSSNFLKEVISVSIHLRLLPEDKLIK